MKQTFFIMSLAAALMVCGSCNKHKYDPDKIRKQLAKEELKGKAKQANDESFEVPFKGDERSVPTVHVKLNDAVGVDAIFDTGCSLPLSISLQEAENISKQHQIQGHSVKDLDVLDIIPTTFADGSKGYAFQSSVTITISDNQGKSHIQKDIKITVVPNQEAPILLGYPLMQALGRHSFTVDHDNQVIRFQ